MLYLELSKLSWSCCKLEKGVFISESLVTVLEIDSLRKISICVFDMPGKYVHFNSLSLPLKTDGKNQVFQEP